MRLIFVLLAAFWVATPLTAETARLITVTGEGRVEAAPDMAMISLGVVTAGDTAAVAMRDNSARISAMLAELDAAGVEARDVQTSNLTINPQFDSNSYRDGRAPKIVGFVASNTVTVRMRDLTTMGGVLDAVLELGANQFNGLSFGLQEPEPAQNEARRRAVADARAKAELYAAAAGVVELGAVVSITEAGHMRPQPMMMQEMAAARSDGVPVAAGEVSTQASVTIVYAIADGE